METCQTSIPIFEGAAADLLQIAASVVADECCRGCALGGWSRSPLSCPSLEPALDGAAPCCAAADGVAR